MITEWETFTDVTAGKLYYRTYDNPDIRMVDLKKFNLSKGPILRYPMEEPVKFKNVTGKFK